MKIFNFANEKKIIINSVKNIIIIFYSQIVILELIFRQKILNQKFLFALGGFGDLLIFLANFYAKKKNYKFANIGSVAENVIKLIVPESRVLNIYFKIPNYRMYYRCFEKIKNSNLIKKTKYDSYELISTKNSKQIKKKIIQTISKYKFENLKILKKNLSKKYICFFVKEPFDDCKNLRNINLNFRSSEKKKILKIINFLLKKKIKILILGDIKEIGTQFLYKYLKKKKYENKIFFLKDYVSIEDIFSKVHIYNNSLGYIGNGGGHAEYFYFLRKKHLIFDYLEIYRPDLRNYKILQSKFNRKYIYKNIKYKNKFISKIKIFKLVVDLKKDLTNVNKHSIVNKYKNYFIETNKISEIKIEIKKFFLIN